jgi:hypothetical protein
MPNWSQVRTEVSAVGSAYDVIRRQHIRALHDYTKRNVIVYYSGWLEKSMLASQGVTGFEVNDSDKNGFMATIHELDRSKGLDLLLHTPGGNVAATESLVDYLRSMFDDIRVIVPQIAMSAGTMIALSADQVVMGKHSSLGPIDPQFGGLPAHGIVEEFNRARAEITADPSTIPLWQPIIAKYNPTLIGEAEKAIEWADDMVRSWLKRWMFKDDANADVKAATILAELSSHAMTLSHDRHISAEKAKQLGVKIVELEADQTLQDLVLTIHHACVQTLSETPSMKITENHNGIASIMAIRQT